MYGTDVSQHNTLNQAQFDKLRVGGIEFCIARASIGADEDTSFVAYARMARAADMLVGAYHYLVPGTTLVQVDRFRASIAKAPIDFVALDVEESGLTQLDVAMFYAGLADPNLGFYTNPSLLPRFEVVHQLFGWDWIARYDSDDRFWLSEIRGQPLDNPPAPLWQFSEKMQFTVGGVRETLDADYFSGDAVDLLRYVGAIG